MKRSKKLFARWDVAAVVVIVVAGAFFVREIGNDFLWGHDGGNGAPAWIAAENAVRFGTWVQLKGQYGLTGTEGAIATNAENPPLLHVHLVLSRLLFGRSEWAGRLMPFLYAVGSLVALYLVAARHYGRRFGFVALLLYVLTPMPAIFATVILPEQGGVFFTLLACDAALRMWRHGDRYRTRFVVMLSLALQFAWVSYFVLGAFGLVLAAVRWRMRRVSPKKGGARARAGRVLRLLAVVAVLNMIVFAVLVLLAHGSFAEMKRAFLHHGEGGLAYVVLWIKRATDLWGAVLLGLFAAGIARLLRRVRTSMLRVRDLLPVSFLLGQGAASAVFASTHAYAMYFVGVGVVLCAADAFVALVRFLDARWLRWQVGIAAALLVALQAHIALTQLEWGLATGHASYAKRYDDQFREVKIAQWLRKEHGTDVRYTIDDAMAVRGEFFYYLDAPHGFGRALPDARGCPRSRCVFIADLRRQRDPRRLAMLRQRAALSATMLFDGHILVVDVGSPPTPPRIFELEEARTTVMHRWLVSARHPAAAWAERESGSLESVLPANDAPQDNKSPHGVFAR